MASHTFHPTALDHSRALFVDSRTRVTQSLYRIDEELELNRIALETAQALVAELAMQKSRLRNTKVRLLQLQDTVHHAIRDLEDADGRRDEFAYDYDTDSSAIVE